MPTTPHTEKHFLGSESVRDVVIGMADGLTVPFALAAGLSAAVTSTHVIVTAGAAIWPRGPIRSILRRKSDVSISRSTSSRSRKRPNYETFSEALACKAPNSTRSLPLYQKTRITGRSL